MNSQGSIGKVDASENSCTQNDFLGIGIVDNHLGQSCAIGKRLFANGIDCCGELDFRQGGASIECVRLDLGKCFVQRNRTHQTTSLEGTLADGNGILWESEIFQRLTVHEGSCANGGDAVGQLYCH